MKRRRPKELPHPLRVVSRTTDCTFRKNAQQQSDSRASDAPSKEGASYKSYSSFLQ
ncbi:hypothetical protein [Bacillus sp. AFS001701]|uniref:hypothetical protein n=1 Tax=Bacillus sp. AFS001701 TaxID=2033480 RepID=UPI0015966D95|nr:hypothetical protein [Bacillus sp. AFS001701]